MSNLNWVDLIILAIFFFSIISGFAKGFVREIVSLLSLIAAFVVATTFSRGLSNAIMNAPSVQGLIAQLSNAIGMNTALPLSYFALGISFAILFSCTTLVGSLVGYFLNAAFQVGVLGLGNRLFGGVFGLFRGYLFNLVLIFVVQLTPLTQQSAWQQSQFVNSFQPAVVWLGNLVSPGISQIKERFGNTLQNVNSSIQQMTNTVTNLGR